MSLDAAIAKLSAERDARTIRQIVRNNSAVLAASGGETNEY
jgi:hypothetical protein